MALITRLRRTGFRKGFTGNRTWLALGLVIWGGQKLRQLATRDAEVLSNVCPSKTQCAPPPRPPPAPRLAAGRDGERRPAQPAA